MEFKKIMAIGLSACMVASLAACGNNDEDINTEPDTETQVEEVVEQEPVVLSPYDGLDISDESLLMGNILNGVAGTYLSDKYVTILSVDQEGATDALDFLGVDAEAVDELAIMYGSDVVPADVVSEIGLSEDSEIYNEALATDENSYSFAVGMIKTADVDVAVETIKAKAVHEETSGITYDTVIKSATEGYVVFSVNTEYALGDSSYVDVNDVDSALVAGLADPDSVAPVISLGTDSSEELLEDVDSGEMLESSEENPEADVDDAIIDNGISDDDGAMEVTGTDINSGDAVGSTGVGSNGAPNTSSTWQ